MMNAYIKHMVHQRCKMLVMDEMTKLGFYDTQIDVGIVKTGKAITSHQGTQVRSNMRGGGMDVLKDKRSLLVENIKTIIHRITHHTADYPDDLFSSIICKETGYTYTYLSNIFTEVTGMSIKQFVIIHRIEKIKELLLFDELNISEISYKLKYCSVAHLSAQFKKVTGMTPSEYKKSMQDNFQLHLEQL